MVIAVDFDGTLFEESYPEVGSPKWDIIDYCKRRKAMGDTLILWTCRARKRLKMAIRACREVGLEFDRHLNHATLVGVIQRVQSKNFKTEKNLTFILLN